ncbi:hypothetical protein LJC56_01015 [Christensenellaceae bacterium OttesenSCG-928-K19]|nr:hypothetical protein [Christensenellaceae bacterium OttesenSCG-928-K19]
MKKTKQWINEVNTLLAKLSNAGQPGVCTFKQGSIDGCEQKGFDDSNWKQVMGKGAPIPGIATDTIATDKEEVKLDLCDWSMVDGPAAMRKKITLPEAIEGLPTAATNIYVTMTMLAPVAVYADGREIARYKYWGDTRLCELNITEAYQPGQTHVVVFKTPENDGDAHLGVCFNYGVVEQAMLELSTAVEQITFAQRLARAYGGDVQAQLQKLEEVLDAEKVAARDWGSIRKMLDGIDETLAPLDKYAKEFKVHVIAHSHLDMNWLWDYEDTIDICVRDFRTICDIMDENPDMCFSQSQTCVYDIVEKNDPETFQRALKKIEEGTWEVTAATWSEHDLNTSGAETFAHQVLTASDYVKNKLHAAPSRVCWEPDTFGFPSGVPNILAKAGVEYFYHFRQGTGHSLNWWEGTDGSRVLDFCFGPYNNSLRPNNLMPVVYELFDKYGMKNSMFVFGVGDHGGGPTRNDIKIKRYLDGKPCLPSLVFSKVCDFFDEALQEKCDYPVHKGEMNFIFEGCYTTKTEIKKLLRHGESRLLDAEAVLAMERIRGRDISADYGKVMRAWEKVCFNGFHDISCGCNVKPADEHDYKIGHEAIEAAQSVNLEMEAEAGDGTITVFNQLGADRDEVVCLDLPKGWPQTGFLEDEQGQAVPYQTLDGKLYFVAFDLPALGTSVFKLAGEDTGVVEDISVTMREGVTDGSVCTVETSRYAMEVSSRSGTIVRLYDKFMECDVLERFVGEPEVVIAYRAERSSNVLMMQYEEPHIMSAWMIGNIEKTVNLLKAQEVTLVANGPVFARLKVTKKIGKTTVEQYITVYEDLDRIDFAVDVDWQELGHYKTGVPMLKVGVTSAEKSPEYSYETPMGFVQRDIHGRELPAYRYVAMHGKDSTLALFNDCKHGFYAMGNTLYMTLVRGSYSPDARPDQGRVQAGYSILPFYGGRNMAAVANGAASFCQKPLAYAGALRGESGQGLFVQHDNIVVTCVKPSNDGKGIVVRLLEACGMATDTGVFLNADLCGAFEADLTERLVRPLAMEDDMARISLQPYENKTIYLELV